MHDNVFEGFNGALEKYNDANYPDVTHLVNYIQTDFKCCGVNTYENWADVPYGKTFSIYQVERKLKSLSFFRKST